MHICTSLTPVGAKKKTQKHPLYAKKQISLQNVAKINR